MQDRGRLKSQVYGVSSRKHMKHCIGGHVEILDTDNLVIYAATQMDRIYIFVRVG